MERLCLVGLIVWLIAAVGAALETRYRMQWEAAKRGEATIALLEGRMPPEGWQGQRRDLANGEIIIAVWPEENADWRVISTMPSAHLFHPAKKPLTIADMGWTREEARGIRRMFSSIIHDWDDPAMDVYDDEYGGKEKDG